MLSIGMRWSIDDVDFVKWYRKIYGKALVFLLVNLGVGALLAVLGLGFDTASTLSSLRTVMTVAFIAGLAIALAIEVLVFAWLSGERKLWKAFVYVLVGGTVTAPLALFFADAVPSMGAFASEGLGLVASYVGAYAAFWLSDENVIKG